MLSAAKLENKEEELNEEEKVMKAIEVKKQAELPVSGFHVVEVIRKMREALQAACSLDNADFQILLEE